MPLQALRSDRSSRQTAQIEGGSRVISVDPIIDEAGGDTEVAIIAPASAVALYPSCKQEQQQQQTSLQWHLISRSSMTGKDQHQRLLMLLNMFGFMDELVTVFLKDADLEGLPL
ncbi:hypothetical protein Emag_000583 [Eimeria magna]